MEMAGNKMLRRMLGGSMAPMMNGEIGEMNKLMAHSGGQLMMTSGMLMGKNPRRFGMPHETFLGRSLSAMRPQSKMKMLFPIRRFLGG